ncbi:MAG: lactate utilization protein [Methylacidiphilales bacterium]|nr:lactate utilization protein [Candidatus Methylacidiphilales bacterium]
MSEREKILGRIREVLKAQAPPPGEALSEPDSIRSRQCLPKVGEPFDEQIVLFAQKLAELKADFQIFNSDTEMKQALVSLRDTAGWKRMARHSGPLTDVLCPVLGIPCLLTDQPYDVHDLEAADAGISECDALVAQTGSVLVTNRSAGGRALSVLPPHHVVLARREQLVADLPAAFELLKQKYGEDFPSMISFISGPSRTGDIERILVLGAHGPKKLTIFVLNTNH